LQLLLKYDVSPEVLFQRFSVLPKYFDISKLFFIRMIHDPIKDSYQIDKELHLNRRHSPHANGLEEHYCRRWSSIVQLKNLAKDSEIVGQPKVGIQFSKYIESQSEYLCFTIARPAYLPSNKHVSVTIGLLVDAELEAKVKLSKDPSIPKKVVSVTCERCPILDCKERAAPPVAIQKREERQQMEDALDRLTNA
jgi:hypothetical protein